MPRRLGAARKPARLPKGVLGGEVLLVRTQLELRILDHFIDLLYVDCIRLV